VDITSRNVAITKALGLEPTKIRKGGVTITLDGELGPVVKVHYLAMGESTVDSLTSEIAHYRLVPVDTEVVPTDSGVEYRPVVQDDEEQSNAEP
jgi:hypothetical protein